MHADGGRERRDHDGGVHADDGGDLDGGDRLDPCFVGADREQRERGVASGLPGLEGRGTLDGHDAWSGGNVRGPWAHAADERWHHVWDGVHVGLFVVGGLSVDPVRDHRGEQHGE